MVESQELWGTTDAMSPNRPVARAYRGRLPEGSFGVEFDTDIESRSDAKPHEAEWSADCAGVRVEDGWVKVPIRVLRVVKKSGEP
jgi:hypothetical protein